jgi:nicotinate-nucleotide pyrophosphorylase (carboxylating)
VTDGGPTVLSDRQIESWLEEDLGHHDVTNDVPGETTGRLVANESGTVAALDAAIAVFEYLDVEATAHVHTGNAVESGTELLTVEGPARAVLRGERTAVNVVGHASGVATRTRAAVEAAKAVDGDVHIAGTRKTTPGLRGVEKRAIAAAGGDTHRLDCSHMVMVKDNHVAEMGLEDAIAHFRERVSFATKIEVEVEQPEDGKRAAAAGADVVLFDNLPPAGVERGVEALPEDVLSEASGGIGIDDVPDYAATGVDVISMGSLTHSAPALDCSFRTGE